MSTLALGGGLELPGGWKLPCPLYFLGFRMALALYLCRRLRCSKYILCFFLKKIFFFFQPAWGMPAYLQKVFYSPGVLTWVVDPLDTASCLFPTFGDAVIQSYFHHPGALWAERGGGLVWDKAGHLGAPSLNCTFTLCPEAGRSGNLGQGCNPPGRKHSGLSGWLRRRASLEVLGELGKTVFEA